MKRYFVPIIVVLLGCCKLMAQNVVFVSADGSDNNNGSSWSAAKQTIAAGISAVSGNGTVFVKAGSYAISAQLVIPTGVSVQGGYKLSSSGTDTTKRELPGTNSRWENASVCTIITGAGGHRIATVRGLLEGCVLRKGYSSTTGGGAQIDGGTVRYCVVIECDAYNETTLSAEGGGVYIFNGGLLSNSVVTECRGDKGPAVSGGNGTLINNTITRNYPTHCGTVADYDGNVYPTVVIGQQCWTRKNLRTTHYHDGTAIPFGHTPSTTQPYYYVNYAAITPQMLENYGYLYNWPAVMNGATSSNANPSGVTGICPYGWHVPSDAEWTEMTDFVNSQTYYRCNGYDAQIAKALASTSGWTTTSNACEVGNNQGGNNATLFAVFPAGSYGGNNTYNYYKGDACFWTSTAYNSTSVWLRNLNNTYTTVRRYHDDKFYGLSVRCVKQMGSSAPVVHTKPIIDADIHSTYAIAGGSCGDAGDPITAYGVCWSTSPHPTINDNHTTDGSGEANFTTQMSGLTNGVTYYVRAYAINGIGVTYGEEYSFTTNNCLDITATDYDGNIYHTVYLGGQCWTKEHMKATHYSNGSAIPEYTNGAYYNHDYKFYFSPNNDPNNVPSFGLLYTWTAATNGGSSSSNPSNVQGVCPTGWHVPSMAEWAQLINYVKSRDEYICDEENKYVSKALASTTGWQTTNDNVCSIGYNQMDNNATGFSAMAAGRHYYGTYDDYNTTDYKGQYSYFWSSDGDSWNTAKYYYASYGSVNYFTGSSYRLFGYSVRCVRN